MVASSSINQMGSLGGNRIRSSDGIQNREAISAIVAAGSPVGQFYRSGGFEPSIAAMQGVSGFEVAGHVALVVAKEADPLSRAAVTASHFLGQYPDSKKISPGSLEQ